MPERGRGFVLKGFRIWEMEMGNVYNVVIYVYVRFVLHKYLLESQLVQITRALSIS